MYQYIYIYTYIHIYIYVCTILSHWIDQVLPIKNPKVLAVLAGICAALQFGAKAWGPSDRPGASGGMGWSKGSKATGNQRFNTFEAEITGDSYKLYHDPSVGDQTC